MSKAFDQRRVSHRILLTGPAGSGRRTLFHALGGPPPTATSGSVVVDAFKRSLGDFRGTGTDVWIQLAHGGLEADRFDRERELIKAADAVICLCDGRPERLEATRRALAQLPRQDRCVFAITHARSQEAQLRLTHALELDSSQCQQLGANDPLGALAVMKAAARICATAPAREVHWPLPELLARLVINR